jgi:hypothetical protein
MFIASEYSHPRNVHGQLVDEWLVNVEWILMECPMGSKGIELEEEPAINKQYIGK